MALRRLRLDTSWGPLTVAGGSRAGEGTLILLPQLRLAFDPGRAHRGLPPMSTVVVSHGHVDHLGALGYWASQRLLNSMGPATLVVPQAIADAVDRLLRVHAELEGGRPYPVEVVAVADGHRHRLRRDLELCFFATDHWVPTLGTRLEWSKSRLRDELSGLDGTEIARRRRAGETVSEEQRIALVSYCADSGPQLLEQRSEVLGSEVVLLECSFFRPADRDRAERYGHLHFEDLISAADRFSCRHLVLLHASRRHRLREVEGILDERLRPALQCQLHHLNVDWD
jgi:ribonuclease BN (tRNA processing enzyme)